MVSKILDVKQEFINGRARGDIPLKEELIKREELIRGGHSYSRITEIVCKMAETPMSNVAVGWKIGISLAFSLMCMLFVLIGYLTWTGVGIWGNAAPVYWG